MTNKGDEQGSERGASDLRLPTLGGFAPRVEFAEATLHTEGFVGSNAVAMPTSNRRR